MYGILLFTLLTLLLFYHRASLAVSTISFIIFYAAYLKWVGFYFFSTCFFVILLGILLFLQIPAWRRRCLAPFFKLFATMLPAMSQTEQEAISAGTVTFEGEI